MRFFHHWKLESGDPQENENKKELIDQTRNDTVIMNHGNP